MAEAQFELPEHPGLDWPGMSRALPVSVLAALALVAAGPVLAHTGERAHVLVLPTRIYVIGGAVVVALSFLVMALLPVAGANAFERLRLDLGRLPWWRPRLPGFVVLLFVLCLIGAGYTGSRDPLVNPLPLVVWVLWWVGLSVIQAAIGDVWSVLNPWPGARLLLTALPGLSRWRERAPFSYPARIGYAPAVVVLLAFAWFELVYPAPQDPQILATAVVGYAVITLIGTLLYGAEAWLGYAEAFTVFFRVVSWLSPFELAADPDDGAGTRRVRITLGPPAMKLLRTGALPASGMAFVLLALASVSFDGLSRTFWWLSAVGENPLEYPGRTALLGVNTVGLLGAFAALLGAYAVAVLLGGALSGRRELATADLGRFVLAIVPIAFGYHFAHYLPTFLVDAQYALRALSDPFDLGWNLLGTRHLHVRASFLSDAHSVRVIWYVQVATIVLAHVAAVVVAHLLALRRSADVRTTVLSQVPMTVLMVGYTLFGLWLLATPVAA